MTMIDKENVSSTFKKTQETKISNVVLYWLFILGNPPQQVS